jgi:hypothetical protein
MTPIHVLPDRIHRDKVFAQGEFDSGCHDRIAGGIICGPLREVCFESGDHFAFDRADAEGELDNIPLQRISGYSGTGN